MKTFIIFIVMFISIEFKSQSQAQSEYVKAMWVWDFYTSISTEEQRVELIEFSISNNINLLFLGSYHTLGHRSSDYEEFIRMAHLKGIRVFALAGKSKWALAENHHEVFDHIDQILDYNSEHSANQFDGIQLDIEPYTLSGFSSNINEMGRQFLQVLQKSADLIKNNSDDLEFNAAIPFWYATSKLPTIVTYNKKSKPLSHHILDMVDSVSIMSYRDHADAQIQVSEADMEYAASKNKIVYVGTETMPPNDDSIPESITYYTKHTIYMNEQLELVEQYYMNHLGFGGIAIHAYDSYKDMHQREQDIAEMKFSILKSAGILAGYNDGNIGLGSKTTRAEVSVIAAKLGGFTDATLYKPKLASFRDVPHQAWSYGWVETAHRMGVMKGRGNDRFDPHSNITVEELLIVMAQSIGISKVDGAVVQGASIWAQEWVQAMINKGYIEMRNNYKAEVIRIDMVNIIFQAYILM